MANRYWVGGTADWDSTAGTKWALTSGGAGGQSVPTSSDDVFFDSASGSVTVTITSDANMRSLDCHGFTGSFVDNNGSFIRIGDSSGGSCYIPNINFDLTSGGMLFVSTTAGNSITILCTPQMNRAASYIEFAGSGGVWNLQSDLNIGSLKISTGTFNANGNNISVSNFDMTSGTTSVINMGSGTWTLIGSSLSIWDGSASGAKTLNRQTSKILITDTSSGNKPFNGAGLTYGNVTITGGGSGSVNITGSNTFGNFIINSPKTIKFATSTTNSFTSFTASGTQPNPVSISSITSTGSHTLSCVSGTNNCTYLILSSSNAIGGATWNAVNSVNSGANVGWNFITQIIPISSFYSNFLTIGVG